MRNWNPDGPEGGIPETEMPSAAGKDRREKAAVHKAMHLLLNRDRSEAELRTRLERDGFKPEEIRRALDYVRGYGYLNDARFAENYLLSYQAKKSRSRIRAELRQKGVDERWIEEAFEAYPSDEENILRELLERKAGPPHRLEEKELRRCAGFLGRRGFSTAAVWKALRAYQADDPES